MSLAVPATVAVVIGVVEGSQVVQGEGFTMQPVIGAFVMGVFLYAISEVDQRLGMLFGVLIVLVTVIDHGQPLLKRLGHWQPQNLATTKKGAKR